MKTYILLLRGINVGGRNVLPMKELIVFLEELGCRNVKTYIQSGNVVFQTGENASSLSTQVNSEVRARRGFDPRALLFNVQDFERAIAANPFPEAEPAPKELHFGFLDSAPTNPDGKKLKALKMRSERFQLIDKVFYLHAPEGIGKSKLAANSERLLGKSMTFRNWRTVSKLRDMAEKLPR